jgi:hypothetical protein
VRSVLTSVTKQKPCQSKAAYCERETFTNGNTRSFSERGNRDKTFGTEQSVWSGHYGGKSDALGRGHECGEVRRKRNRRWRAERRVRARKSVICVEVTEGRTRGRGRGN